MQVMLTALIDQAVYMPALCNLSMQSAETTALMLQQEYVNLTTAGQRIG